jgi:hypothetical protein
MHAQLWTSIHIARPCHVYTEQGRGPTMLCQACVPTHSCTSMNMPTIPAHPCAYPQISTHNRASALRAAIVSVDHREFRLFDCHAALLVGTNCIPSFAASACCNSAYVWIRHVCIGIACRTYLDVGHRLTRGFIRFATIFSPENSLGRKYV